MYSYISDTENHPIKKNYLPISKNNCSEVDKDGSLVPRLPNLKMVRFQHYNNNTKGVVVLQ